MANSVKGSVVIRQADGTDYASPNATQYSALIPEVTDVTQYIDGDIQVLVNGVTVSLPSTTYGILVRNLDSTNYVTAVVSDSQGNTTTYAIEVGNTLLLTGTTGFTSDLTLTANTAALTCRVFTWGK